MELFLLFFSAWWYDATSFSIFLVTLSSPLSFRYSAFIAEPDTAVRRVMMKIHYFRRRCRLLLSFHIHTAVVRLHAEVYYTQRFFFFFAVTPLPGIFSSSLLLLLSLFSSFSPLPSFHIVTDAYQDALLFTLFAIIFLLPPCRCWCFPFWLQMTWVFRFAWCQDSDIVFERWCFFFSLFSRFREDTPDDYRYRLRLPSTDHHHYRLRQHGFSFSLLDRFFAGAPLLFAFYALRHDYIFMPYAAAITEI